MLHAEILNPEFELIECGGSSYTYPDELIDIIIKEFSKEEIINSYTLGLFFKLRCKVFEKLNLDPVEIDIYTLYYDKDIERWVRTTG